MGYCERSDIEARYGAIVVAKWADANASQDAAEITARITLAIDNATDFIEAALRGGPHVIPLTTPFPSGLPRIIIDATARLAGYDLIAHRGVADGEGEEPHNRLSEERQRAIETIDMIRKGRLKLDDSAARLGAPGIVSQTTSTDDD